MQIKQFFLSALIFSSAFVGVQAQSSLNLSLAEAKSYAIEHNRSLQQADLSTKQSQQVLWQTIAEGLPQVTASYSYQNMLGFDLEIMGMGIEMKPTSNAQLQVTQLLFSGNYFVGVKMSKLAKEMTLTNQKKSELDICRNIADSYHSILVAQELLTVLQGNLSNMQDVLKNTEKMVEVGVAEKTSADQLRVQVALMENNIKSAERQVELGMNMMRFQLGTDPKTELVLTNNLENFISEDAVNSMLLEPFDIDKNYDMIMLEQSVKLAESEVQMAGTNFLPTVAGFYNYTYKINASDFDMQPPHVLGVTASMPLFTSFKNTSKYKQAKLKVKSADLDKQSVTDQLLLQEKQLRFNLRNTFESYQTQKENIEVSKSVYQNIVQKFQQGAASSLDLSNANNNLLVAQSNYIQSMMQLLTAETELNNLMGKK